MRGEAATPTRCSAARWLRSLVLALSKCLVAAAPVVRPVVSMTPAGRVPGRTDCKMLDRLPHFLRRERSSGRVGMQMQLDWQENLPLPNGGGCARKSSFLPSKMLSGNDMGK